MFELFAMVVMFGGLSALLDFVRILEANKKPVWAWDSKAPSFGTGFRTVALAADEHGENVEKLKLLQ